MSSLSYSEDENIDPELANRINEINKYESLEGTWEGNYIVKSAPEELFKALKKDGVLETGIGVKVILKEGEIPEVFYKHTANSSWKESSGEISLVPDKLGFHIYIASEGGVWLERVWLSFARVSEKNMEMTFTRTVHNWHDEGHPDALEFYHVFGSGSANKI